MSKIPRRPTAAVGRADLLHATAHGPSSEDEQRIARLLGFGRSAIDERDALSDATAPLAIERAPAVTTMSRPPLRRPTKFWRVAEVTADPETHSRVQETEPEPPALQLRSKDLGPDPAADDPPSLQPLVPWPRLRRVMEEVCRRPHPIGDVDVDAVVERIGRGELLQRLPRRLRRVRPPRVVVIIDWAERLIPFRGDQLAVYRHLREEIGRSGLTVHLRRRGPPVGDTDEDLVAALDPQLEAGDVVVVLGDLGHYAEQRDALECTGLDADRSPSWLQRGWARLGEALGRHEVAAAALLLCPADRWIPEVVRNWWAIDWVEPSRTAAGVPRSLDDQARRRNRLLILVSWTQRLEPALLRDIRLCLPPDEADTGTEADVWNYEWTHDRSKDRADGVEDRTGVRGGARQGVYRHPAGLLLPDRLRQSLHDDLEHLLATRSDLMRRVVGCVRRHHAGLARELWLDEVRGILSLDGGDAVMSAKSQDDGITLSERRDMVELTRKVWSYVRTEHNERESLGPNIDIRGWLLRDVVDGQPAKAFSHPDWGGWLHDIWDVLEPNVEGREMPLGVDLRRLRSRRPGSTELRFVVSQVGGELHVAAEGSEHAQRGSPLATVVTLGGRLRVGSKHYRLDGDAVCRIPLPPGDSITLATDRVPMLELKLAPKPPWARAMGRDEQGLWVQYGEDRLEWPDWAHEVDEDEFGLWATFRVGEVEQRMRWIRPGRFLMGSPEGEEGRYDLEGPQHQVTLTQGYWLADTPCTQALWEAVTGDNPSRFHSALRPVEQVSWEDAQRFCEQLDQRVPGLRAELPTEAQWEYACRAGTTTSTYVGDLDIRGSNDAPVLDAVAWYGGNSGKDYDLDESTNSSAWPNKQYPHTRAGTRVVAQKQPNQWGLYDMLGNVYEWCRDMQRSYEATAVEDPLGSAGERRVPRGGSWSSYARCVRAAYRYWRDPGIRDVSLGFRLFRGQEGRQPEQATSKEQGRGARVRDEPGTRPAPPRDRR